MSESKTILTKKDLNLLALNSVLLQGSFNYERMQAGGWCAALASSLEKIHGKNSNELSEALQDNLRFINTHPTLSTFLMGLLVAMEEAHEPRELINGIKNSLFGPIAGIGDALFWFTLLPILAGICGSLAQQGSILGPTIFFAVFFVIFLSRFILVRTGYDLGVKAISKIKNQTVKISRVATILGTTVIGGLIASYVSISLLTEITISEGTVVSLQADLIDNIFPNILPALITGLMYYLLKHKKVKPTILIFATIIVAIALSYLYIV